MQSSNRAFYFLSIGAIVIAAFFVTWKMLLPTYFLNKADLATINSEVQQERAKLDSVEKAKADLSSVGDIVDKIFIAVPKDEDSPNLISELEAVALKNDLVVPSISVSDPQIPSSGSELGRGISKVRVSLSLNGTFEQLSSFLTSVEKSIKYMEVASFSFSSAGSSMSLSLQIDALSRNSASAENISQ